VRNYILVAENRHISQRASSLRDAVEQINKDLIDKGEKTPRKKSQEKNDTAAAGSTSNGSGPIDGKQLLADVNRAQQVAALLTNEDVVPGLHQAIDKKDKAGIAKSVFDRLKATELVKAEMVEVLRELRLMVDAHPWPGEPAKQTITPSRPIMGGTPAQH
jgi:hypothetical protein